MNLDLPPPTTAELPPPPMASESPALVMTELHPPTTVEPSALASTELLPPVTTKPPDLLSLSGDGRSYHHRLQQFEKSSHLAVLREKLKGYERELVSMVAEDARFRETVAVKERHIGRLKNLLHTWSITTVSDRREYGDYYTQEDIKQTLQRQIQTMGEIRGVLNCLKYEVETLRLRISDTWEMIEQLEKNEEQPVGRGKDFDMVTGKSNEHSMQIDS